MKETLRKKITASFYEKCTDKLESRVEVVVSGQIFKDNVKGFSSNSDIWLMDLSKG
jgi:hypothetical protein